jgi:hypothetical protein
MCDTNTNILVSRVTVSAKDETGLEVATRHVAEGEDRCARQRTLIKRMAAAGQDTAEAEAVLQRFEQTLGLLRQHQQGLLRQADKQP